MKAEYRLATWLTSGRLFMAGALLAASAAYTGPALAASAFDEAFSAGTLPPNLETVGGAGSDVSPGTTCCGGQVGGPVFESGAVRFQGRDTRGDNSGGLRAYLRTIEADYSSVNFVAEVTLTIPANAGRNIMFFGLGPVLPVDIFGGPDKSGIQVQVTPSNFFPQSLIFNGQTTLNTLACGGNGTYRVRLEWNAQTKKAVASIDRNYAGGAFIADCTLGPLDGSSVGFDATNARIYIGGDWDAVFDDFVVRIVPTAVAGNNRSTRVGDTVRLDGSASFDDNTPAAALAYAWSFVSKPAASVATLTGDVTATPTFVADVAGTYELKLEVIDEDGLVGSDTVTITTDSVNQAPSASAGNDQLVVVGTPVVLNGSGSGDPESDPVSFNWEIVSAPTGSAAAISSPHAPLAGLTPDLAGVYVVKLTVSDPIGPGSPDTVEITAASNQDFAETKIAGTATILTTLAPSEVTSAGNQSALGNFLSQAVSAIQKGKSKTAIKKLDDAIERTDGCEANGTPDTKGSGRDWITDCAAQATALASLRAAREALQP